VNVLSVLDMITFNNPSARRLPLVAKTANLGTTAITWIICMQRYPPVSNRAVYLEFSRLCDLAQTKGPLRRRGHDDAGGT